MPHSMPMKWINITMMILTVVTMLTSNIYFMKYYNLTKAKNKKHNLNIWKW
uniref:ATP synthase F0 subunit 8 n=1 Tax=Aposthonia borneensis TaxID=1208762 RepID=A0A343CXL4_9NEOP|nr:ATP synthase F0 subunit 8 [Aposthonia borneensis]